MIESRLTISNRILNQCRVEACLEDEPKGQAESKNWWDSSGYEPVRGTRMLTTDEVAWVWGVMEKIQTGPTSGGCPIGWVGERDGDREGVERGPLQMVCFHFFGMDGIAGTGTVNDRIGGVSSGCE